MRLITTRYGLLQAHYPSSPRLDGGDENVATGLGVGAHTDSGLLTLIACSSGGGGLRNERARTASRRGGLQALAPDGVTWIDVEPERDSLILNFGEVLEMATGVRRLISC